MRADAERLIGLLKGKRILSVGLGVSHIELAGLLADSGLDVTACDKREAAQLGPVCDALAGKGVRLLLGEDYPKDFDADVLLRTPGMYYHSPQLEDFRGRGGVVTSEMELFCALCPCPLIAVTGSDGKTTTSTLTSKLLEAVGYNVHLGGNIGRALLPKLGDISENDVAVVELSSFQLISMRPSPQVSVLTNVTPNHLDVHRDMSEYVGAKRNIFMHQDAFSVTVLNGDDPVTASFAPEIRGQSRLFSLRGEVATGAFLGRDGVLYRAEYGNITPLLHMDEVLLPGIHNVANLLAAVCAVGNLAGPEKIAEVAKTFAGVEHRIELTRVLDGVKWYNDSIATSPTRAMAGIASFGQKIILIAGGKDKNLDYSPLAPSLMEKVKLLILTGETSGKIANALISHPNYSGRPEIVYARDLAGAVAVARQNAGPGDIVSLSPASASFDCYKNFEERGRHFKELVAAL